MNDAAPLSVGGDFDYGGIDLNYLVNRIFRGGPAPQDPLQGDVNADGLSGNIVDLNYFVNFVFRGGPHPVKLEN